MDSFILEYLAKKLNDNVGKDDIVSTKSIFCRYGNPQDKGVDSHS